MFSFATISGVPRANIAATPEHPYGTTAGNYAELNKDRPVLAQHVAFFDKVSPREHTKSPEAR